MACDVNELRHIPLFALLDDEEIAVLATQVELRRFAARQRIYKIGDAGGQAYVLMSGSVQVTTVDDDNQEVLVDEPKHGELFGFASMLEQTAHQTNAMAVEETTCLEVDRNDIAILLQRKPMAGMDMLTVIARQLHAHQQLVRDRVTRNANEVIDEEMTFGNRIADVVARFGGSWNFIISFSVVLVILYAVNVRLRGEGVGSLSVYFAESVSVDAGSDPGSGDYDEPEPAGYEGSCARRTGLRGESPG